MLPDLGTAINVAIQVEETKSKNYKMHLHEEYVAGYADKLEAMKQVVFKILSTERYKYKIYSWDYGVELENLFGKPVDYVVPELRRRIRDALIQDERIIEVDEFDFDTSKCSVVAVNFTVHTIYGDFVSGKEVKY